MIKTKVYSFTLFIISILQFINVSAQPPGFINSPGSDFCTSQTVVYSIVNYDPAYTYNWYIDYSTNFSSTGQVSSIFYGSGASIQVPTSANTGITVRAEKINSSGTVVATDGYSQICNLSPFTIPSYYDNTGCGRISVPLAFSKYLTIFGTIPSRWAMWYKDGLPTGRTIELYDDPYLEGGVYQYKLLLTCGDTLSTLPISIARAPIPIITASGPTNICTGDSVTLTMSTPGLQISTWLKDGIQIPGTANPTILTVFNSGNYSVNVYSGVPGNGCVQTTATSVLVAPAAVINSSSSGCAGDSILLQSTTAASYLWKLNGNTIIGSNSQSIWVKVSGQYQVITTGLTCNISTPKTITFYTKPTINITPVGSLVLCAGTAYTLSANGTNISGFQWYRNNISLTGGNLANITITKNGTYKCIASNQIGCTKSSASLVITTPTTNALPSATLILQPDSSGFDAWIRKANGGLLNHSNSFLLEVSNYFNDIYTVDWAAIKFDLSKLPTNAPITNATLKIWIDTVATNHNTAQYLTIKRFTSSWNENSIQWNGTTPTDFQQSSISLQTLTSKSYLSVNISDFVKHWSLNPAENFGFRLQTENIYQYGWWMEIASGDNTTAIHRPKLTIQYSYAKIDSSGPLNLCSGGSVTFTTNSGYNYQWYRNGSAIAGATSVNYTAITAGNYYVTLSNTSGCSVNSETRTVSINATPIVNITPAGTSTFCLASSLVLSADSLYGYSFQWKRNGTNIAGATLRKYTATQGGTYAVTITSNCGLSATGSVQSTQISNPLPSITAGGPTTFCAGQSVLFTANTFAGVTYQWRKNGTDINGQTTQTYNATTAGSYSIKETANGCSRTSAVTNVIVNCRIGNVEEQTNNVVIMPDPFTTFTYFTLPEDINSENIYFILYDINGKVLARLNCEGTTTRFDRNDLSNGMYLLKTYQNNQEIGRNRIILQD